MNSEDAKKFAEECFNDGICPACLNAGECNDHHLDMFGDCTNCGARRIPIEF